MAEAEKNIDATTAELEKTKKLLAEAKADLATAVFKMPFSQGSVYPIGLDHLTLGMHISGVLQLYPSAKSAEPDYAFMPVITNHPIFGRITYYWDQTDKDKVITMIMFQPGARSPLPSGYWIKLFTRFSVRLSLGKMALIGRRRPKSRLKSTLVGSSLSEKKTSLRYG